MDTLSSLAFLQANINASTGISDRLDYFMPLMLEVLHKLEGTHFSLDDVRRLLIREFELALPGPVVGSLLRRCCRKNYLVKNNGRYERTNKKLPYSAATEKRREIDSKLNRLVDALTQYASTEGVGVFSTTQVRKMLGKYLDFNFKSLSLGTLSDVDEKTHEEDNDVRWINRFIRISMGENQEIIETIVELVRGRVVFDAAMLPGFADGPQTFSGVRIFLDSPVLCSIFGYVSKEDQRLYKEAVALLQEAGAKIEVLDCTVKELESVMESVYTNWGHPRPGEPPRSYIYTMPEQGFNRDEAKLVSADGEVKIRQELGINSVEVPSRNRQFVVDEAALEKRLQRKNHANWSQKNRIKHDIDCISAVMTIRSGKTASRIKGSRAFFVSESKLTIQNIRKWWNIDEARNDLPPIFSLIDLANLAWLYSPKQDSSILKDTVMSTCAAAMVPTDRVWQAWVTIISEHQRSGKITEEDACQLLFSNDIKSALAEYDAIDTQDETFFNNFLSDASKGIAAKYYAQDYQKINETISKDQQRIGLLEDEKKQLESSVRRYKDEVEHLQNDREKRIREITRVVVFLIKLLIGALFAAMIYLLVYDFDLDNFKSIDYIQVVIAIITFAGGIALHFSKVKNAIYKLIDSRL